VSEPEAKPAKSRRRFLGVVGASGLATAAAVFSRSSPALAANYGCCNLQYPDGPRRVSYATCKTYGERYDWLCWRDSQHKSYCQCCEGKQNHVTVVSGAACWNR